jgi:hypothetical protein
MANLGNAWHLPSFAEPFIGKAMRTPVDPLVPGATIFITTGNQFAGDGGNPGNQLQDGSALLFKRATAAEWTAVPSVFLSQVGNNKYYETAIPPGTFAAGDTVQYYLRIAYSDHDRTYLAASPTGSTTTGDETAAQASPFTFTVEASAVRGQWSPVFRLPNVAIHAHVLPSGKVLMWGRRDDPDPSASLDPHECTPFVWNPPAGTGADAFTFTAQPTRPDGTTKVNLFCSGHSFLPDGRLLVAGGHLHDSVGVNQAALYDPQSGHWLPQPDMNDGRWYPTALSLPDGGVLVLSGNESEGTGPTNPGPINPLPQIWRGGAWTTGIGLQQGSFELYPRVHVVSDGSLVMTGPQQMTEVLKGGSWHDLANREERRDYAPSVMYDQDKVIYIGGGNDKETHLPSAHVQTLDLTAAAPHWKTITPMSFPRRHHNATILPDGTILVTGGTQGGGGPGPGFNDLTPGAPVHVAELWNPDPAKEPWTLMAAELVDRCYHSTAVLLPDGRVLSAGGGEYTPNGDGVPNAAQDTHRDAQIFSPPYLFGGPQPVVTSVQKSVDYGATFVLGTPTPADVARISLVRLSSTTHSFNMNQRIKFLDFTIDGADLKVTAPASSSECPPGHYMLFLLNQAGVPSVARIIQIAQAGPAAAAVAAEARLGAERVRAPADTALARREAVLSAVRGTEVRVGVVPTCPYGLGACWGGAHEALLRLDGVHSVDPVPDAEHSTATVFLREHGLPRLDRWKDRFGEIVGGTYAFRGVEVTLTGTATLHDERLELAAEASRPRVSLEPLNPADKVQWIATAGTAEPASAEEASAFERLLTSVAAAREERRVTVTGPLGLRGDSYRMQVRRFDGS